jgi:hypothetical protein
MAERKPPKTSKATKAAAASRVTPSAARRVDHGFARVLQQRVPDRVLADVVGRLEEARRRYVVEVGTALEVEHEILAAEARRLAGGDDPGQGRAAQALVAVETEAAALRDVVREMERAPSLEPDGFTVVGRVLTRTGHAPEKAEVVFLGPEGRDLGRAGLEPLAVDADGMVRQSYPADVARKLEESGVQVTVAVRIGKRVVATDDTAVRVRAGRLLQFDLRIGAS